MKKYLQIALMFLLIVAVSSCKDDDDNSKEVEQAAYKLENETAFLAKKQDPSYVQWMSQANDGFVFAKLIKKGNGKQIFFNSRVSVYYKGSLIDGTVFDQKLFDDGVPFKCAVSSYYAGTVTNPVTGVKTNYSSVIAGWGVALQNMVEGDKYEVWIPQELGYGATANGDLKPYSTLIFEIEVVSVDEQAVSAN